MSILEIWEQILSMADDVGIEKEDLLEYQLHIDTSNDTSGVINTVHHDIDINTTEQIVYINIEIY